MGTTNRIYNIQEWQQITVAATPSSGTSILYPKTDGNWYYMNSDGIEKLQTLSYDIGNGLTASTASAPYNYKLSVNIDNYGITLSNGRLSIGYITASSLSQLGSATAGYILSVNTTGLPQWVPYTTQGINGVLNYIAKFDSASSLTSSNIFDSGTNVNIFTSSNSIYANLFINNSVDINGSLFFNSNNLTKILGVGNRLTINSSGLLLQDTATSYQYLNSSVDNINGNSITLLNNLFRLTATGSSNFTASLVMTSVNIGIGTATPSNLLHILSTSPAFRLQDGNQASNKFLVSDANGVASWYSLNVIGLSFSGLTLSLILRNNSGLTNSSAGLGIQLPTVSGLTLSSNGLDINPSIAGFGLSYSSGVLSVTPAALSIGVGNGLTYVGTTISVVLGNNSGLSFSSGQLIINPNIAGNGLTFSGGSMSVLNSSFVSGTVNYIPVFDSSSSLTSSVIYQINNNIIIGTISNIGAKLYVNGTFSFTNDGIINNINIGRGNSTTNLLFGNNALSATTPGNNNIAIGDGSLILNQGSDNISIGFSASNGITTATASIAIGSYAMDNNSINSNAIGIGYAAGNFAGQNSISIGSYAGSRIFGNAANTIAIGFGSGAVSSGSSNIFLGYLSGQSFTGSYSVFIGGYDSTLSTSNNIFISDGQGNLRIYSPASGNILVGTMSETGARLVINGSASFYGRLSIMDGTQASGRLLVSDSNGNTSWIMPVGLGMTISGYTFSINLQNNSGLTVSTGLGINLQNNSGLTTSSGLGVILQNNSGLTTSSGLGIVLQNNSGLTLSNTGLAINSSIAGYGLTFSSGSMSFTTTINGNQGYIPYFNAISSLTNSVIYQTSSNILIGTTINDGSKLVVNGSASFNGFIYSSGYHTIGTTSNYNYGLQINGFTNSFVILSTTESNYGTISGTTSYIWNTVNNGKLSWVNTLYGSNELASIQVTGDGFNGFNNGPTATLPYSFNTGNIIFSIGSSASVATEKVRFTNTNMVLASTYSLQIGGTLAQSTTNNGEGNKSTSNPNPIKALLSVKYNSSQGGILIWDTSTINRPPGMLAITNTNTANNNANSVSILSPLPNSFTPTALSTFVGSIYPGFGNGAYMTNLYISSNFQYGMFIRQSSATNANYSIIPGSLSSNESYIYVSNIFLTGTSGTYSYNSFISYPQINNSSNGRVKMNIVDFRASNFFFGGCNFMTASIDRYGILIDYNASTATSSGTNSVSYNNAWGVYQSDSLTNNYFNGPSIHGTTSNPQNALVSIYGTGSGLFQLKDSTYGAGKFLVSDANGVATWQTYKYAATQSFVANTSYVINHNLNTLFYIIQLFDYPTGDEILGAYTNRGLTQATITLSATVPNCGVVIIG